MRRETVEAIKRKVPAREMLPLYEAERADLLEILEYEHRVEVRDKITEDLLTVRMVIDVLRMQTENPAPSGDGAEG